MRKVTIEFTFLPANPQTGELAEQEVHETFTQLVTSLRNQVNNVQGTIKFSEAE